MAAARVLAYQIVNVHVSPSYGDVLWQPCMLEIIGQFGSRDKSLQTYKQTEICDQQSKFEPLLVCWARY